MQDERSYVQNVMKLMVPDLTWAFVAKFDSKVPGSASGELK